MVNISLSLNVLSHLRNISLVFNHNPITYFQLTWQPVEFANQRFFVAPLPICLKYVAGFKFRLKRYVPLQKNVSIWILTSLALYNIQLAKCWKLFVNHCLNVYIHHIHGLEVSSNIYNDLLSSLTYALLRWSLNCVAEMWCMTKFFLFTHTMHSDTMQTFHSSDQALRWQEIAVHVTYFYIFVFCRMLLQLLITW